MYVNQTKLMHQLILITNTFLRLIDKYKKKTHACHPIGKGINKAVKK